MEGDLVYPLQFSVQRIGLYLLSVARKSNQGRRSSFSRGIRSDHSRDAQQYCRRQPNPTASNNAHCWLAYAGLRELRPAATPQHPTVKPQLHAVVLAAIITQANCNALAGMLAVICRSVWMVGGDNNEEGGGRKKTSEGMREVHQTTNTDSEDN